MHLLDEPILIERKPLQRQAEFAAPAIEGEASFIRLVKCQVNPKAQKPFQSLGNIGIPSLADLPVAIPGGMLTLGDVHALQGDSECSGTGIECAAEVTLTVRRVKDPLWPSVYLVRDDKLMVFSHGETVDDAAWGAVASMAELLTKLTGLSDFESRGLLSTAGEVRISQIVNPKKTCRAVIPREAIPNHWPF